MQDRIPLQDVRRAARVVVDYLIKDEEDYYGYGNDSRQNGPLSSRFLHNKALARTGRGSERGLSV